MTGDWLKDFVDSTHIWIWEMDIKGVHTYSNDAVEDILGYSADEIIGMDSIDLWPERTRTEKQVKRHLGSLRSGKGWKGFQALFQHKDGHPIYTLSSGAPVYGKDGELIGYHGMDHEITLRVEREKELRISREKTLELAEILELINSILMHDIRNDLFTLSTALELFMEKGDRRLLDDSPRILDRSTGTIERMKELKRYTANQEPLGPVNVNDALEEILQGFEIDAEIQGILEITADDAIYSVFENIIRNSIVHGGSTGITFRLGELEGKKIIRIADNGSGIPEDIRSDLFDEFFSFGKTGGSGIGLYIVKKAIERYGGQIELSNGSSGAVFLITLPQ